MRRHVLIYGTLLTLTLLLFWPVRGHDFINYDDYEYVTENPHVKSGLSWENIRWAFSRSHSGNWHPLTWISHMIDCELFGLEAGKHHLVNVSFHILNTLLLFLVMTKMTGTVWRSAFVAALFAWHPMHVQSVAWIAERKDVLSGFFAMLTLLAYRQYVLRPCLMRYLAMAFFFVLGLMAKPMLVTLPFVLLLLDFWPLKRWQPLTTSPTLPGFFPTRLGNFPQLFLEKTPLLLLVLISCVVTLWAQRKADFVVDTASLAWHWRGINALVFYTAYLAKLFWPANLAIFYPFPQMELPELIAAALVPLGLTALFVRVARQRPYILIGWLIFLGMLVPVIGLVQVGMQAIADRYTYLPAIGLFIMAAFCLGDIAANSRLGRNVAVMIAAIACTACVLLTRAEVPRWQNSITIFSRAVAVTSGRNFVSYFMLGNGWGERSEFERAAAAYRIALQINPAFEPAHFYLGYVLMRQGKFVEAELELRWVLNRSPGDLQARLHLGGTLAGQGRDAEAAAEFRSILELKPDNVPARDGLVSVLARQGQTDEALDCIREGLRVRPTPEAWATAAVLLTERKSYAEAARHYVEALKLRPDSPAQLNNLAWLLATCDDDRVRNGPEAVRHAERACALTGYKEPILLGTLAAAYAENGQFPEAITAAEKAMDAADKSGATEIALRNGELLKLYRAGRPFRERPSSK